MNPDILNKKHLINNLENNIYNFKLNIARSSNKIVNVQPFFKWVNCAPSRWPNQILDVNISDDIVDEKIDYIKENILKGDAPNYLFLGPRAYSKRFETQLLRKGFTQFTRWSGMILKLEDRNVFPGSIEDFKIKTVSSIGELKIWSSILNEAMFGGGFEGADLFANLYKTSDVILYLGMYGDTPVATSCVFFDSKIAGLFLISTRPEYRNRGFGTRMTAAPLDAASKKGIIYSGLYATVLGERVYKKLGFSKYCDFFIYYI